MQWIINHKELLEIVSSFVVTLGFLFSLIIINQNRKTIRQMKQAYEADLFFKISSSLDDLAKEQKEIEKRQKQDGDEEILLNWYERLFNVLDDFCYIANRGMIPDQMISHYSDTVTDYCKDLSAYPKAKERIFSKEVSQYGEIRKFFKKQTGEKIPN
jgi:hypothetical protein